MTGLLLPILLGAAVVGALVAVGARALVARLLAARRARAALAALGPHRHRRVEVLATGKVLVVEGRARARSAASASGASGREVAVTIRRSGEPDHTRATDLRLDTDDASLAIDGLVHVALGSSGSRRPVDVGRFAVSRGWSGRHPAEVLRDGDRVAARGVLREEASGGARDADVVRVLVPPHGERAVNIVALGTPRELAPRGRLIAAACGAVVGAGIAATRAPATPKYVLYAEPHLPCPADLDAQLDRGELAAPGRAQACGDYARAARGWWQLGEFAKASRAFASARAVHAPLPPSASEVAAHLFAGDPRAAAGAARAVAATMNAGTTPNAWTCLADALDARAGDGAAGGRLDSAAAAGEASSAGRAPNAPDDEKRSNARLCALLSVDRLDGEARSSAITRLWHPNWGYQFDGSQDPWIRDDEALDSYVFYLLRREVEPARPIRAPSWYRPDAYWPGAIVLRLPMALIDRARPSLAARSPGADARVLADYDVHVAVFLSYAGAHARARTEIDAALGLMNATGCAAPDGGGVPCRADRDLLSPAAAVALRARDLPRAEILLHRAAEATEAHGYAVLRPYIDLMRSDDPAAFAALLQAHDRDPDWTTASSRDGAELARALEEGHRDGRDVLPYVAGYMLSGQDALRSFVAGAYPPPCWTCGPHALLDHVSHRREAAQALGMTDLEARLGPTADRFVEAFLRRDVAVPLHVLARLAK